jgi:hypothetical protein
MIENFSFLVSSICNFFLTIMLEEHYNNIIIWIEKENMGKPQFRINFVDLKLASGILFSR